MRWSFSSLNFLNALLVGAVFAGVIAYFFIYAPQRDFAEHAAEMEARYIDGQRALVKREVERVVTRIEFARERLMNRIENDLRERVEAAFRSATETVREIPERGRDDTLAHIAHALGVQRWMENSGYYVLLDRDGEAFAHPSGKALNLFTIDNPAIAAITAILRREGEAYGVYPWPSPEGGTTTLRAAFIRYHPQLDIYIAAAVSVPEMERALQRELIEQLRNERFGRDGYGYIWIHDHTPTMIMHPMVPYLEGKHIAHLVDSTGNRFILGFVELARTQGAGFSTYRWYRPGTHVEDKKVSYLQDLGRWGWIVGSGFYFSDLETAIQEERREMEARMHSDVRQAATVLALLMLVTISLSFYLSRRVRRIEREQQRYLSLMEQYKAVLDHSAIVSKTDLEGRITYVNDHYALACGYAPEEMIGRSHNLVRHPDTPKALFKELWTTIHAGRIWQGVIKNRTRTGGSFYNKVTIVPLRDEEGRVEEFISAGNDITEQVENLDVLEKIFSTDPLTSLGSRVKLLSELPSLQQPMLALVDLDRFREINDLHGHERGDRILESVGDRLFSFFDDPRYTLYRLQSDVFAVAADGVDQDAFVTALRQYQENLAATPLVLDDGEMLYLQCTIGVSSGIGSLPVADIALKAAKTAKQSLIVYDSEEVQEVHEYQENQRWLAKLKRALNDGRIIPYYQPIVDARSGRVSKYECLMRLIDDDGQVIPPAAFLDISKRSRLYPMLTARIGEKAIQRFRNSPDSFSINLTVEDLTNAETMDYLFRSARHNGTIQRMVLEVVESEDLTGYDEARRALERFKEHGAKVAIDDFGSGYSNFEYLISLGADYIKIDGSIIKRVVEDERAHGIVTSIVQFARSSRMETVAEFVASAEIAETLRGLGVDYFQGYHFGAPAVEPIAPAVYPDGSPGSGAPDHAA